MTYEENNNDSLVKKEEQKQDISSAWKSETKISDKSIRVPVKGTQQHDLEHGTNFANKNSNEKLEIPTLNISQEIADIIELDRNNPSRVDPHISGDLAGNQMYFDCYVPDDYAVSQRGWYKIGERIDRYTHEPVPTVDLICSTRLMPTGKFVNADTGADVLELTYVDYDKVEVIHVPLVGVHSSKRWDSYVRKNDYGRLYVLDTELKETLEFIKKTVQYNEERINKADPKNSITKFKTGEAFERTGWSGKDFSKFVIGILLYENYYGSVKAKSAVFMDSKDINVDKRLSPKGTARGWFDAVRSIVKYPKLRFAMYYAIGSLFLAPLKTPNSAFGIIGDTSTGKTFTLQAVASMFGNPSEKGDGLILNGNISLTALNAILTSLTDIPIFIDEITLMHDDTKKALTYAIGNGQEALRGKQDGNLRSSRMIRCNAIITGEVDIVSEFSHNGAKVRAFSCRERPIPEVEQSIIRNARKGILENYGHVLHSVINKYYTEQNKVEGWYEFALDRLQNSTNDTLSKRKAEYFACAEVGGRLLESLFKEHGITPVNVIDIINEMWEEFVLDNPDIPLEVKALGDVYRWALSHPKNFLVGDQQPVEKNPPDLYGWWVYPKCINYGQYEYLDLNKQELEKFLKSIGYERPLGILQYWRNHDITVCNTSSNGKKDKDGSKKLLTFAVWHNYHHNKPPKNNGIIRIRMDKIKELIKVVNTEEEQVRESLRTINDEYLSTQDTLLDKNELPYDTFGLNKGPDEWMLN